MKLKSIQITNFKSIKSLIFDIKENYHVFAGKNESGKTNILEAFSYLDENKEISQLMIREPLPDEKPIDKSDIYFVFEPDILEKHAALKKYKDLFYNYDEIKGIQIISWFGDKYSVNEFFENRLECLINVDFIDKTRLYQYWSLGTYYKLLDNWKKVKDTCPEDASFIDKKGKSVKVGKSKIICTDLFKELPEEHLEDFKPNLLNVTIGSVLTDKLKTFEPSCTHWFYNQENILPAKVELNAFKENPFTCVPLKYLFDLSGIDNIKAEIDLASSKSIKSVRNLLSRVSKHSTLFFNEKWKEYDNIEFDLTVNGNQIEIGIKEQNCYDFSQRSDGFKRFVTFLIMISAKVKTNQLKDSLLLIDEPEIGLHPSGQRYLRKELRAISKNNTVVFCTHSIFLVDTDDLRNHYIVEKKSEETKIKEIETSNIVDEEVIFNALGYSVFESLKQKNLLFEGWRDKYLFKVAISRIPSVYKEVHDLKSFGLTHSKGVKEIKYITPVLELANRDCLIISDADNPAMEKRKEYLLSPQPFKWTCYNELLKDEIAITAEDFIKSEVIIKFLKEFSSKYKISMLSEDKLEHPKGKIHAINQWLKPYSKENIKEDLNTLKEKLFADLKPSHIETKYYLMLKNILKIVGN